MDITNNKKNIVLFIIILISGFFVFYNLTQADTLTDEVEIAFRSIGYLDFLATPYQTTPYEWFNYVPDWAKLSFHDHPPFIFLIENIIFKIFTDSVFWLRLPFALFGLASIILIYLLSQILFNEKVGLLAAMIAGTNSYLIWISRIGLQEIIVIFFSLLAIYFLVKTSQKPIYFIYWGIAMGFGFLTKYTTFIILFISFTYICLVVPKYFKNKNIYLGIILSIFLFSPVVIYNLNMYNTVGHFDLQLSTLLKQTTPEWSVLPGKNIGNLTTRILGFYPNLKNNSSPLFFIVLLATYISFGYLLIKKIINQEKIKNELFLITILIGYHLLIFLIGPSERFLVMIIPYYIILIAYTFFGFFDFLQTKKIYRYLFYFLLILFVSYEGFFMYQTTNAKTPITDSPWVYSKLKNESSNWGYNELENYLSKLLDNKKPTVILTLPERLNFIQEFRDKDSRKNKNNRSESILIIYDPRINNVAKFWLYDRRYYYDGWPFISVDEYISVQKIMPDYFINNLKINKYYYIASTPNTFTAGNTQNSENALTFEDKLKQKNIPIIKEINDKNKKVVFRIYNFNQE